MQHQFPGGKACGLCPGKPSECSSVGGAYAYGMDSLSFSKFVEYSSKIQQQMLV